MSESVQLLWELPDLDLQLLVLLLQLQGPLLCHQDPPAGLVSTLPHRDVVPLASQPVLCAVLADAPLSHRGTHGWQDERRREFLRIRVATFYTSHSVQTCTPSLTCKLLPWLWWGFPEPAVLLRQEDVYGRYDSPIICSSILSSLLPLNPWDWLYVIMSIETKLDDPAGLEDVGLSVTWAWFGYGFIHSWMTEDTLDSHICWVSMS